MYRGKSCNISIRELSNYQNHIFIDVFFKQKYENAFLKLSIQGA